MQDTVRVQNKGGTVFIAHRGLSGMETKNTVGAFQLAGTRSYFGIETDLHCTKDGKFVVFHDDTLQFMAGQDLKVEQTDFETLRQLPLYPTRFRRRVGDKTNALRIPALQEYMEICRRYNKTAVLELKKPFTKADIFRLCDEIAATGWLERTIFISFYFENLVFVREKSPLQPVQLVTTEVKDFDALLSKLQAHGFDWDAYHFTVTPAQVQACHIAGVRVNVWAVDEKIHARRLIKAGVDFITTDILE